MQTINMTTMNKTNHHRHQHLHADQNDDNNDDHDDEYSTHIPHHYLQEHEQQQPHHRATIIGTIISKILSRIQSRYEAIVRTVKSIGSYLKLPTTTTTTATTVGSIVSISATYYWLVGTVLASMLLVAGVLVLPTTDDEIPSYRVAFLGNSITFVNDLPRFMVELANAASTSPTTTASSSSSSYISSLASSYTNNNNNKNQPKMIQNSCLHSSLSFRSFLQKGNGMYRKWQTPNALLLNLSSSALFPYYEDGTTMINDDSIASSTDDDSVSSDDRILIYDYGACTVNQLLFGYDEDLVEDNANGKYKNDGMNPCIKDTNYLHYLQAKYMEEKLNETGTTLYTKTTSTKKRRSLKTKWDYVVMNDQTVYPGIASKRKRSIRALTKTYSKLFLKTKTSIPVFLATYGYMKSTYYYTTQQQHSYYSRSSSSNGNSRSSSSSKSKKYKNGYGSTDDDAITDDIYSMYENYTDPTYDYLGDMVHFTSRTWYGYKQYAIELGKLLPKEQQPIIAPIGPAFLLLYEENLNMWENKLFYDDGYHPSPHGTFLIGCILYATLYGRMPSSNIYTIPSDYIPTTTSSSSYDSDDDTTTNTPTLAHLWKHSRRMQMSDMGSDRPYPTVEEAMYLMNVAERVTLNGVLPNSLLSYEQVEAMEREEAEEEAAAAAAEANEEYNNNGDRY